MVRVLSVGELAGDRVSRFEGRDHGSSVSLFLGTFPPGSGPGLHHHPYDETFVIEEGEATFTVDGEELRVGAGQIVVVPAGAVHGFVSSGEGDLRQVSIHPSDHMVQEFLENA
jgi:quercetin dioxygenase-like cupin family protein